MNGTTRDRCPQHGVTWYSTREAAAVAITAYEAARHHVAVAPGRPASLTAQPCDVDGTVRWHALPAATSGTAVGGPSACSSLCTPSQLHAALRATRRHCVSDLGAREHLARLLEAIDHAIRGDRILPFDIELAYAELVAALAHTAPQAVPAAAPTSTAAATGLQP